jgi:archaeosine synthase beta-subunit
MPRDLLESVEAGAERGQKSYCYDGVHSLREPVDYFFQESFEGVILFIIFRTPPCRHSACTFCPLPQASTLRHVEFWQYCEQIDAVFRDPAVKARSHEIVKVIASNQGSILDEETFPTLALMHLVIKLERRISNLELLCLESRPEYVDDIELEMLRRAMREIDADTGIEIAIGLEAFDDHLRNAILEKGLVLSGGGPHTLESLARRCGEKGFALKCYFMQKPWHTLTDAQAIEDVKQAIDYLDELARKYGVKINMHLNPTFAAKGTQLASAFEDGRFVPPQLRDVAKAALHAKDKQITLFIGLNDEGMAVSGGSFLRPGQEWMVEMLEVFNRTQDFEVLKAVASRMPHRKAWAALRKQTNYVARRLRRRALRMQARARQLGTSHANTKR